MPNRFISSEALATEVRTMTGRPMPKVKMPGVSFVEEGASFRKHNVRRASQGRSSFSGLSGCELKQQDKPKILISNPNFAVPGYKLIEAEIMLFRTLFREGYQVYLWQGKEVDFGKQTSIATLKGFDQAKTRMVVADKDSIADGLSRQGKSKWDFCILDEENWDALQQKLELVSEDSSWQIIVEPQDFINGNRLRAKLRERLLGCRRVLLGYLNAGQVEEVIRAAPRLQEISLGDCSLSAIKLSHLSRLERVHIERCDNLNLDRDDLPGRLKVLKIEGIEGFTKTKPCGKRLQKVAINEPSLLKRKDVISALEGVEELVCSRHKRAGRELSLDGLMITESIEISEIEDGMWSVTIENAPLVKRIKVRSEVTNLKVSNCPNLEELIISRVYDPLEISGVPNLHTLTLGNVELAEEKLESISGVTRLNIHSYSSLQLFGFKKLESLTLTGITGSGGLACSSFPNLRELRFIECRLPLSFPKEMPPIEVLTFENNEKEGINLDLFRERFFKLKKLKVKGLGWMHIHLSKFSDLEVLEVDDVSETNLKGGFGSSIKKVTLIGCKQGTRSPDMFKKAENLEEIYLGDMVCHEFFAGLFDIESKLPIEKITLHKFGVGFDFIDLPCRYFEFHGHLLDNKTELQISDRGFLETIYLHDINGLKKLVLENCQNLIRLEISNCPDLEEISIEQKINCDIVSINKCPKFSGVDRNKFPSLRYFKINAKAVVADQDKSSGKEVVPAESPRGFNLVDFSYRFQEWFGLDTRAIREDSGSYYVRSPDSLLLTRMYKIVGSIVSRKKIELYRDGEKQDPAHYLCVIRDKAKVCNDGVRLECSDNFEELKVGSIKYSSMNRGDLAKKMRGQNVGRGEMTIELFAGMKYPLTILQPGNVLLEVLTDNLQIKFYRHTITKQPFVEFTDKSRSSAWVKLVYSFGLNALPKTLEYEADIAVSKENLLNPELRQKIEDSLRDFPPLLFLFNKNLFPEKKVSLLIHYFKGQKYNSPYEMFIRGGRCAQFASNFHLLLRYLNIRSLFCSSIEHGFVIVPHGNTTNPSYSLAEVTPGRHVSASFKLSVAVFSPHSVANGSYSIISKVTNDLRFATSREIPEYFDPAYLTRKFRLCVANNVLRPDVKEKIWNIMPVLGGDINEKLTDLISTHIAAFEKLISANNIKRGKAFVTTVIREALSANYYSELSGKCLLMMLLRYFNIPARLDVEDGAGSVHVPLMDKDDIIGWYDVEEVFMTKNPIKKRVKKLEEKVEVEEDEEENEQERGEEEDKEWREKFVKKFKRGIETIVVDSIPEYLELLQQHNCVVELSYGQTACDINNRILELVPANDRLQKHLYINSSKDFCDFFEGCKITETSRTYLAPTDTPLGRLINSDGYLVINWCDFYPEQIACYKTLLDKVRTIDGELVSKQLKIVNIIDHKTKIPEPTLKRCKKVMLSHRCFMNQVPGLSKKEAGELHIEEKDLFGTNVFLEDTIFGEITVDGDKFAIEQPPLIRLITAARERLGEQDVVLVLHNVPADCAECENLFYRVNQERKIYYQGTMYSVPENFKLEMGNKKTDLSGAKIKWLTELPAEPKNIFYLNYANYYGLEKLMKVDDSTKTARLVDGWLERFAAGDIIYVTSDIPHFLWCKIVTYIKQHYPEKEFEFMLAPGCRIEKVKAKQGVLLDEEVTVHAANDLDLRVEELRKDFPEAMVIDVTRDTTYQNIIDKIIDKDVEVGGKRRITFTRIESPHLADILSRQIIFRGEMSPALYQQLLPLFSEYRSLWINGKREEVTHRAHYVMPFSHQSTCKPLRVKTRQYKFEDYEEKITDPVDRENLVKIKRFKEFAERWCHVGDGLPSAVRITYARLWRMLAALKNQTTDNPVKPIFNYDYHPETEAYAYMNVMAKLVFHNADEDLGSPVIQIDKLRNLEQELKQKYGNDIDLRDDRTARRYSWQLLNCFNAEALQEIFNGRLNVLLQPGTTELSGLRWSRFFIFIRPYLYANSDSFDIKKAKDGQVQVDAREKELLRLLLDSEEKIIFLKGEPGSGKTYLLKNKIANNPGIILHNSIESWQQDHSHGKVKLLLLDEANRKEPGYWDRLKEFIFANPTHKIAATGNFENSPNCYYHPLLQDHAYTMHIKMPRKKYIKTHMLREKLAPYIDGDGGVLTQVVEQIYFIYQLMQKTNKFISTSLRFLDEFVAHFILALQRRAGKGKNIDYQLLLYKTALYHFTNSIYDPKQRLLFLTKIGEHLKASYGKPRKPERLDSSKPDSMIILPSRYSVVKQLKHLLKLREEFIKDSENIILKAPRKNVLRVGPSGIGKSTLFMELLDVSGYKRITSDSGKPYIDSQQRYYTVSVGAKNAKEILLRAFHEGSIVVLEECNLKEEYDAYEDKIPPRETVKHLLLQLEQGNDLDNNPPAKPGFMVLGSQNSGNIMGREASGAAGVDRNTFISDQNYSEQELVGLAEVLGLTTNIAELIASAHQEVCKNHIRLFFDKLQEVARENRPPPPLVEPPSTMGCD